MEGGKKWMEEEVIATDDEEVSVRGPLPADDYVKYRAPGRTGSVTSPPLPDPFFNPPAEAHPLTETLSHTNSASTNNSEVNVGAILHLSRSRSPSVASPPAPPPFFNPPADEPVIHPEVISTPASATSSASASASASVSASESFSRLAGVHQSHGSASDLSDLLAQRRPSLSEILLAPSHRPELKPLQRGSSNSVPSAAISAGEDSFSSAPSAQSAGQDSASDAEEHLHAARQRLLDDQLEDRRDTITAETYKNPFEFNVTTPTPPLGPKALLDDGQQPVVADPIDPKVNLGRRGSVTLEEIAQDEPERAWDSVWPAPGTASRSQAPPELANPTFPIAPISPFVTPVFSPAAIGASAIGPSPIGSSSKASPPSPRTTAISPTNQRSPSPVRISGQRERESPTYESFGPTGESSTSGRRGSITHSHSPLSRSPTITSPVPINRHSRSKSSSSPNATNSLHFPGVPLDRKLATPPASPRSSPTRRHITLSSSASATRSQRSSSPMRPRGSGGVAVQTAPAATQAGPPRRLSEISPPAMSIAQQSRPRGASLSIERPSSVSPREVPVQIRNETTADRPNYERKTSTTSTGSQSDPLPATNDPFNPTNILPPINLPPPITSSPVVAGQHLDKLPSRSLGQVAPSSKLARPVVLRRAISDYERKTTPSQETPIPLNRSLSDLAEIKGTKRSPIVADIVTAGGSGGSDRIKKSPRKSPKSLPTAALTMTTNDEDVPPIPNVPTRSPDAQALPGDSNQVAIVDEGDVLPSESAMEDMAFDVTFDDEGLSTLERIFLLSKSDFPFHRAYVARVLGDLLHEVDPCESVEYVLPLISGFTVDDDEAVKEALVSELHRILWYFFTTCRMYIEGEEDPEDLAPIPDLDLGPNQADPLDAAGPSSPLEPTTAEETRRPSLADTLVGSSHGSSFRRQASATSNTDVTTPGTDISANSEHTMFDPEPEPDYLGSKADSLDLQSVKDQTIPSGPPHALPPLPTNFFTPLLGALLLNNNPTITEMCRSCVVKVIGRLRGKLEVDPTVWGSEVESPKPSGHQIFTSQSGPHSHEIRALDARTRRIVEDEMIRGIVVGMASLSTEMPYDLMPCADEGLTEEERQSAVAEAELFKEQLTAEALAGRATSLNLLGSLCEYYTGDEAAERGFAEEIIRCPDGDTTVRSEGAYALKSFSSIAPAEDIPSLMSVFEQLMRDETTNVRQAVTVALPSLCRRIDDRDARRSFAVSAMSSLTNGDADVRFAALEALGEIIYVFDGDVEGPPDDLIRIFVDDEEKPDLSPEDWDYVTSYNFPGVALTLGAGKWSLLRDLYRRLLSRANERTMLCLAASLHELSKILNSSPSDIINDLIPAFQQCAAGPEGVREKVYEHFDVFLQHLPHKAGWDVLHDLVDRWEAGKVGGWRAREQVANHIPAYLKIFTSVKEASVILDLEKMALHDPFAAIRWAAKKGFTEAYQQLDPNLAERFVNILIDLGGSSASKRRVTFLRCLRDFIKIEVNREAFESNFVPQLGRFSTDVVDVRLALAQVLRNLFNAGACYHRRELPIPPLLAQLTHTLAADESVDVRDAIGKIDLGRLPRVGLPHSALNIVTPLEKRDPMATLDVAKLGATGPAPS